MPRQDWPHRSKGATGNGRGPRSGTGNWEESRERTWGVGQWSVDNGQWSMVNGRWSMVNGQWFVDTVRRSGLKHRHGTSFWLLLHHPSLVFSRNGGGNRRPPSKRSSWTRCVFVSRMAWRLLQNSAN